MSENIVARPRTVEEMIVAIAGNLQRMETDEEFAKELREGHPSGNPITLGPRLPTAADHTKLQIDGAKANAGKWLDRVKHPKKNFKEEALKAKAKYKDSMQQVLDKDLWAGGMENVHEDEAMAVIDKIGSSGYSNGVAAREPKILRVNQELREARLALCATIDALDNATDADRENKMLENKRGLQAIGLARRGAK